MDPQEATFEKLLALEEVWTGGGVVQYPTIATLRYREALTIQAVPGQPRLFVLERTQKKTEQGEWVESHWESGFLRALPDGAVEWLNAQSGGRVEVLRGTLQPTEEGFALDLTSSLVANDARMGTTARQLVLRGETLSYRMEMSTNRVPELTRHIESELLAFVDRMELLRRLQAGRAEFVQAIAPLTDEELTRPRTMGEWSVKDLLAHFIAHEQRALDGLNAARNGRRGAAAADEDEEFNERAVRARQNLSAAQVRAEWDASFERLYTAAAELDEGDFEPFSAVCEHLENTIDGALAGSTYRHYAEHLPGVLNLAQSRQTIRT